MHVERSFPPTAEAPRAVRAWIREILHSEQLAPLEHTASLLVTELVTNAVLHARTPLSVAIEIVGDGLRISVADESPTGPTLRTYDAEAATGRGLHLVDVLSARWGMESRPTGKAVWCELVAPTDGPAGGDWPDPAADAAGPSERSEHVG